MKKTYIMPSAEAIKMDTTASILVGVSTFNENSLPNTYQQAPPYESGSRFTQESLWDKPW